MTTTVNSQEVVNYRVITSYDGTQARYTEFEGVKAVKCYHPIINGVLKTHIFHLECMTELIKSIKPD